MTHFKIYVETSVASQAAESYLLKPWFTPFWYILTFCIFTPPRASDTLGQGSFIHIGMVYVLSNTHLGRPLSNQVAGLTGPDFARGCRDTAYFSYGWTPNLYLGRQNFLSSPHGLQVLFQGCFCKQMGDLHPSAGRAQVILRVLQTRQHKTQIILNQNMEIATESIFWYVPHSPHAMHVRPPLSNLCEAQFYLSSFYFHFRS